MVATISSDKKSVQTADPDLMALADQFLAHVRDDVTFMTSEIVEIPAAHYSDPDRWSREVETIFRRNPIGLAFSHELSEPGSYKTVEIAGIPLLLSRGRDGVMRGFINACRHRGMMVAEGCGKASRFTCTYHGWTYDEKGRLVGVSHSPSFGQFEKQSRGLRPINIEERHGLVFGILTPEVPLDLDAWLGPMDAILQNMRLDRIRPIQTTSIDGPNWKVAMDGYLETYHFDSLHKTTFNAFLMANALKVVPSGPHLEKMFAFRSILGLADEPRDQWEPDRHIGRSLFLFPNTIIGLHPRNVGTEVGWEGEYILMEQVFPGAAPHQSITLQSALINEPVTAEQDAFLKNLAAVQRGVVENEDYWAGSRIQRALPSQSEETFLFGRNEVALQLFHENIDRLLACGQTPTVWAERPTAIP